MKWDDDDLKHEKYLILDAIVKFSQTVEGQEFKNISLKSLMEFIDKFCDFYYSKGKLNEKVSN